MELTVMFFFTWTRAFIRGKNKVFYINNVNFEAFHQVTNRLFLKSVYIYM